MDYNRPDTDTMLAAFMSSDFSRDESAWNEEVEKDRPDEAYIPELEHGNYTTPVLERLREAWREYQSGALDQERMEALLERCLDSLDNLLLVMRQCVSEGIDDAGNPITSAIAIGFAEHRQAVLGMRGFFLTRNIMAVEDGLAAAQAATNRLMDAFAFFQRLRCAAAHSVCPHCEAENPRASTRCAQCTGALPGLPEKGEPQLLALAAEGVIAGEHEAAATTANCERVAAAVAEWEGASGDGVAPEGSQGDDHLWQEITAVEAIMQTHREANKRQRSELSGLPDAEQKVVLALLNGVDVALGAGVRALAKMKKYWDDGSPDHVRSGYEALGQSTQQILEAYQVSQYVLYKAGAAA